MARDGAGSYTLPAGNPVTTNTPISSTVQNNTMSDIATALTQSLAKDGQTVPTSNIQMGGFKVTKLANGAVSDDAAAFGQVSSSTYGSRGLVGKVNATTPLTKYDLSVDVVMLKNASNVAVVRTAVAAITCDLGLAGSAANGRDQAGAFTAGTWVYLYFIWNGTTLATLASATAPPTGPTLPTGYTHWCFATALRWNGSSNIIPCRTQGNNVWYDLATGDVNRVQAGGVATTMTTVGLSGFCPPNATQALLYANLSYTHNAIAEFDLYLRPAGANNAGQIVVSAVTEVTNQGVVANSIIPLFMGTSSNIEYKLNTAPSTAGGANIDVLGFTMPNGG